MKNLLKAAPFAALLIMLSSCGGGGGGTADPKDIGDSALKKFLAKDFDSMIDLLDQSTGDWSGREEVENWRKAEGYEIWKDYKDRLEGDNGMDPKSKSGIDGESKWKEMSAGKDWALRNGFYKLYACDDLDKRLEMKWVHTSTSTDLKIEGQGEGSVTYMNGYGDRLTVSCVRRGGLWYMTDANPKMDKELPKKPKTD